jgi:hypothetical protein
MKTLFQAALRPRFKIGVAVVDSLYIAGKPRISVQKRIGPDVSRTRVMNLSPDVPGAVVANPRYHESDGSVLLRLKEVAKLGRSRAIDAAATVFESNVRITEIHLAVDVFDVSPHFFRTNVLVSGTRSNGIYHGTLYYGQRGGDSQVAIYDKLRESNAKARQTNDSNSLTRIRGINRRYQYWVRIERRYKGKRLPARHLEELQALADINPFDCVQFRPLSGIDPGRFTGNDFFLAHGIQRCIETGLSQAEMRSKFGPNFHRFHANHADLFEQITTPDLHQLYQESITQWLRR